MWKTRLKIVGLFLLILVGLGVLLGLMLPYLGPWRARPVFYNTASVLRSIQSVNQLVSVKYVMEKVVVLEDPPKSIYGKFLTGESRVILVAHGVIKAGVDLSKITEDNIRLSGTNLFINLPPSEITDVYLDEQKTQIVEHKTGFLRKFDATLPQTARQQALDEMRRAAKYGDILTEADTRAREQLKKLFAPLGIGVECK